MVLEKQALRWSQEVIGTSWHSGMWKNRQNTVYDIETTILVGTLVWPNFLSVTCDLMVQFVLTLLSVITDSLSVCRQEEILLQTTLELLGGEKTLTIQKRKQLSLTVTTWCH